MNTIQSMDKIIKSGFADFCVTEAMVFGKEKRVVDADDEDEKEKKFKSKNLNAERRRRKKLSDRQLELRSLVPIITKMNKTAIITDAITYIGELKRNVKDLIEQLHRMEEESGSSVIKEDTHHCAFDQLEKWEIKPEVEVMKMEEGRKVWIKMIFERKKRGELTKLMEAMTTLVGLHLADTSITTCKGVVLLTFSVEMNHGELQPDAGQIKHFLWEIINGS